MSSNAGSHERRRGDRHGREHETESNASSNQRHGEDRRHRSRSGSRRSSASIAFRTEKTNSGRKTSAELTIGVGALERDSESDGVGDRSASVRFGVQLFDESEEDGRKTKRQHPISSIGKSRGGKAGNGKEKVLDESPRESQVSSVRSSRDDDDTGSSAISSRPTTPVPLVDPTAFGGENWQGNGSIPPPHGSTPNGVGHNFPGASISGKQNAQNRASRSPERVRGDQFPQDSRDGSPASTSSTAGVLGVRQESPRASGAENSSQDGAASASSTTSSQGTISKSPSPVPGKEGSKGRVTPSSNDGSNQSSPSRAPGSLIGPPPKKTGSHTSSQAGSNQGPGSPRVKAPQTREAARETGSPLNRSGVDGAGNPHTRSTRGKHPSASGAAAAVGAGSPLDPPGVDGAGSPHIRRTRGNHPPDAQRARRSVADLTLPGGALLTRHGERQHHERDGGRRSPESSRTSTSDSSSAEEEEDREQGKKHGSRRRRLVVGEETTVKGTKTFKVGINPDTGRIETKQDRKEREKKGRELEKGEKGHGHGHHTEKVTSKKTSTSWEFDPAEPSVTRTTSYRTKTTTRRSRDRLGEDGVGPGAS